MDKGLSFLKNKTARRFCWIFILCAFIPTIALILISYNKVINQLETQGYNRLKREVKSYGYSLFDRLIRLDNELQAIGRAFSPEKTLNIAVNRKHASDLKTLFLSIGIYSDKKSWASIYNAFDPTPIKPSLTENIVGKDKSFIFSSTGAGQIARIYLGANIQKAGIKPYTIVAEIRPEYLWGIGPAPILPPMTELWVYDKNAKTIVSSHNHFPSHFKDLNVKQNRNNRTTFQLKMDGKAYLASISNLFLESRFQHTGWTIIFCTTKENVMSAMDSFKSTFPGIILLFLLLILYFSILFIRKNLEPLETLKKGTKRIAKKDFSIPIEITSDDEFQDLGDSFNNMSSQLDKQFQALTVLNEIDRAILSSFDKKTILATTLQKLKVFFHCDISVFIKASQTSKDHYKMYILKGQRISDPKIAFGTFKNDEKSTLFTDYESMIVDPDQNMPSFLENIHPKERYHYLLLPLSIDNQIDRILILGWKNKREPNEEELSQARQITNQLAIALTNSNLLESMENLAMGTIEALARTVDAKSQWTSGHSERVSELAGETGKAMGLSDKEVNTLIKGGLLHDIGKIGIPVAILDKPGKLTNDEYKEIQRHPEIGAKILEPITVYQDIIPLVGQHHEKFDGSGYPYGLKNDQIHITARILAVVDVWDALVSDRPYREGWIHDRAIKLLRDNSGTHFDPEVVNTFFTVIEKN
jgi:putative nucleotidyltransferase with HDIG domain